MAEDIGSLFHDNERRLRKVESRGRTATPTFETFRNLFINGDFEIDQRNSGAAQAISSTASFKYTVDRWFVYPMGASVTGQRIATNTTDRYKGTPNRFTYRLTGNTGNENVYFGQRIEAVNSHHLAGQKATLQADIILSSSQFRNVTWVACYANTADTFGTVLAPTKVEFARGQWSVRDAIKNYTATFDVPAEAVTGIEIIFIIPNLGASQTVSFADVQFEAGPNPSPFEHRHFGAELALCQRYYYRSGGGLYTKYGNGVVNTTSTAYVTTPLPVPLRVLPTSISVTAGAAANVIASGLSIYDGTTSPLITSIVIDYASPTLPSFLATCSAATLTAGRPAFIQSQASTTAFFSIDVEL